MNTRVLLARTAIAMIWLCTLIPSSTADETTPPHLDSNLAPLQPLVNKTWVGQIKALDSDGYLDLDRRYAVIWEGKAIRISGGCAELNNIREGYIYWDSEAGKIALFSINNKGTTQRGYIDTEDGNIVITGKITFASRTLDFRNVFELTPDGTLIDRWYRFEDNEWKAGHTVELRVADQ